MKRVYLDNNATTPIDPSVSKAILECLLDSPLNPSSIHYFGRRAKSRLVKARETIAKAFRVKPEELIFTSGGTEAINLFLRGLPQKGHIISTDVEHAAVFETLKSLPHEITFLSVNEQGAPTLEQIKNAIRPDTIALVFSASNSETGAMIDLEKVAGLALEKKILLFIDAVSFIGKEPFIVYPGISAFSMSAHKFHGPQGAGLLYLRSDVSLDSSLTGGPQENQKRAGTENLSAIVGMSLAVEIFSKNQQEITDHIKSLQKRFEEGLKKIPNVEIIGNGPRICSTTNAIFLDVDAESLLMLLDQENIAASHGSACSSGSIEPSRVLINMGISRKKAKSSIRFSFSRMNTIDEIDTVIDRLKAIIQQLKY